MLIWRQPLNDSNINLYISSMRTIPPIKIRCRGIILHDRKLFIVKHTRGNEYYATPGGHLDHGEDPRECIVRELVEELGVEPILGELLYVYTFIDKDGRQSMEFFFEILNGEAYLQVSEEATHKDEIVESRWVAPTDIFTLLPQEIESDFREGNLLHDKTRFIKGETRQVS